jgi:hypothetical protein
MPIDPITGEEEDALDLSSYYNEEEAGPPSDLPESFPSGSAIEMDRYLTSQVPAPNYDSGHVMGPVQSIGAPGAATQEYLSGKPGLFIQGGSSVPQGQIMVNGRLEKSQASPQPLPWWIREADQFKEQRRQEDEALRLAQQFPTLEASAAMDKARQLQGRLELRALINSGMPLPQAYAQVADKLYGSRAPRAVADLVATAGKHQAKPFMPTTWTSPEGVKFTQTSPHQWTRDVIPKSVKEPNLSPGQKAAAYRAAASAASEEGDTKRAKEMMAKHDAILESSEQKKPADLTQAETRLLNKKTGKTQIFPGKLDPKQVDPSRFEILK